jgi:RNA polymerase sigma-70 factor (ECF subfamily)
MRHARQHALAGAAVTDYHRVMPSRTSDPGAGAADEDLLAAHVAGDPSAAAELARRHGPRALSLALRMLGERAEAEDVAQEALLRLWRAAPDWRRGEAQVSTWLYRVVSNLSIDALRRRKRRGPPLDQVPEIADGAPHATERMQTEARAAALQAALADLPDRQRQAVVLRHIEGLANPEIAEIMDISVAAVESLTARGKRMLAAALSGRRDELGLGDD